MTSRRILLPALVLALFACDKPGVEEPPPPVTLAPPPAGQGFQVKTAAYTVDSGTEDQRCYFFEAPETETWVNRIQTAVNAGSHHVNLFRMRTIKGLDGNPGDVVIQGQCLVGPNWSDWPLVTNQQDSNPAHRPSEWRFPAGVGQKFEPREKLMLQVHYVNATTQVTPAAAQAIVNLWTVEKTAVTAEMGTLFATNQNIKVCPGDADRYYQAACHINGNNPGTEPITVIAANGHFHSRGTRFLMSVLDAHGVEAPAPFYESTTWDEPPFARGLSVIVQPGGSVRWTCHFAMPAGTCGDPNNQCCTTFGPKVETQEHCNAFVYYYPKSADVICF